MRHRWRSCSRLLLAWLLLGHTACPWAVGVALQQCEGKKVAILDLETLATAKGFKTCSLDVKHVYVNMENGIVYSGSENPPEQLVEHFYGTHSAPWFLAEALRKSQYYTPDLDAADIVFVYDYCYYITWLGFVHEKGRDIQETPGDDLLAAYEAMMELPRWRARGGLDFVFYDSHPGFAAGKSARPYGDLKCVTFRNATHLIVDTPMRNVCDRARGGMWPMNKLMVTPYVPNRLEVASPAAHLAKPTKSRVERDIFIYHRALCARIRSRANGYNAGKMMRNYLAFAFLREADDIMVKCTNHDHPAAAGGSHLAFKDMYEEMSRSVFCLALPGDAASTRRFSEIFMAACIPVFVGPPYHSMPFVDDVDYRPASVFFNITNYSPWMNSRMQDQLSHEQHADHETEARWWIPDADISDVVIKLDRVEDVVDVLRQMPPREVDHKLALMAQLRSVFSFDTQLTEPPNAANVLLEGICRRGTQPPIIPQLRPKIEGSEHSTAE